PWRRRSSSASRAMRIQPITGSATPGASAPTHPKSIASPSGWNRSPRPRPTIRKRRPNRPQTPDRDAAGRLAGDGSVGLGVARLKVEPALGGVVDELQLALLKAAVPVFPVHELEFLGRQPVGPADAHPRLVPGHVQI